MTTIFDEPLPTAQARVAQQMRSLAGASADERLLSFNTEPLYTAADLLGRDDADAHVVTYLALARAVLSNDAVTIA